MASYASDSVLVAEAAVLSAPTNTALPSIQTVPWNTLHHGGLDDVGLYPAPTASVMPTTSFRLRVQQSLAPIKSHRLRRR